MTALQAAWLAIVTTAVPQDDPSAGVFRADYLRLALDAAVRAGNDTDTVAAIAGGLLGAAYGFSAVPVAWRTVLHGWPGIAARDLAAMAGTIVRKGVPAGQPDYADYQFGALTPHPYDDQVLLGDAGALRDRPVGVTAVVSLCRLADDDVPRGWPHTEVRLIDSESADENLHLDFVLLQSVQEVERFRVQGRTVLLRCVQAFSRTLTVAALYGARRKGVGTDEALQDVMDVLPPGLTRMRRSERPCGGLVSGEWVAAQLSPMS